MTEPRRVRTEAGVERFGKGIGEAINPRTSTAARPIEVHAPWETPSVPPAFDSPASQRDWQESIPPAVATYTLPASAKRDAERMRDVNQA